MVLVYLGGTYSNGGGCVDDVILLLLRTILIMSVLSAGRDGNSYSGCRC